MSSWAKKVQNVRHSGRIEWVVMVLSFSGIWTSAGCCIYAKPHKFGESDTESDNSDDDDCCHEHRVARRRGPHKNKDDQSQDS